MGVDGEILNPARVDLYSCHVTRSVFRFLLPQVPEGLYKWFWHMLDLDAKTNLRLSRTDIFAKRIPRPSELEYELFQ